MESAFSCASPLACSQHRQDQKVRSLCALPLLPFLYLMKRKPRGSMVGLDRSGRRWKSNQARRLRFPSGLSVGNQSDVITKLWQWTGCDFNFLSVTSKVLSLSNFSSILKGHRETKIQICLNLQLGHVLVNPLEVENIISWNAFNTYTWPTQHHILA